MLLLKGSILITINGKPQIEATHKKKYYANEAVLLNSRGIGSPIEDSRLMKPFRCSFKWEIWRGVTDISAPVGAFLV